jgi:hypothetical protein
MKYYLPRHGDHNRLAMTRMSYPEIYNCLKALYSITQEDIYGWYNYCGYV